MIGAYVLAAVALLAMGATLGFLALVVLGIRREETAGSVKRPTSDPIAGGARTVNGLGVRSEEDLLSDRPETGVPT